MFGRRDVIGDKAVASIEAGLSGGDAPVEVKRFDNSGHLPHLDEREEYVAVRDTAQHAEGGGRRGLLLGPPAFLLCSVFFGSRVISRPQTGILKYVDSPAQ